MSMSIPGSTNPHSRFATLAIVTIIIIMLITPCHLPMPCRKCTLAAAHSMQRRMAAALLVPPLAKLPPWPLAVSA